MMKKKQSGLKHSAKMNGIINSLENDNSGQNDYYSRERTKMRSKGYTEQEINQMSAPNQGDPDIKE